jgi:tetratricopeptide (TPR) repeat protein
MIRRTLLFLLLCVGSGILIVGCSKTFVGEFPSPPQPPSPVESRESTKEERIRDLYDSLTEADWEGLDRFVPHPKDVEIRVEGMDAFTAAKYLQSHGLYQHYASEYAKRAVAENPGNFEILLFYAKTLGSDKIDEREATYRQLYEMAPDSIDVLYGLGGVLSIARKPDEAVVHLEKIVAMNPSHAIHVSAYRALGASYRELGQWDEAVAAYEKAGELEPGVRWITDDAIEVVNEMRKEAEARNRVGIETENTPSEK